MGPKILSLVERWSLSRRFIHPVISMELKQSVPSGEVVPISEGPLSEVPLLVNIFVSANFPWLEPLLSRAIRRSAAGKAWKLLYGTGTRLIRDRIENPQPPKVHLKSHAFRETSLYFYEGMLHNTCYS